MEEEGENVVALLYEDAGTSNGDVLCAALEAAFSTLGNNIGSWGLHLVRVSANDIVDGSCFADANIIIFPGGRDLPYVAKLQGPGVENIQKFVEKGGKYLGICAGAYFASSYCEFEKGTDLEVCGERDLKLFPGKAKGCVYPGFQYDTENGARMMNVNLILNHNESIGNFPVYYNGGCEFILDSESNSMEVESIANYEDFPDKNAIVFCKYGNGRVLLSGVHPEINYMFLQDKSEYSMEQLQVMAAKSQQQQKLLILLLEMILMK